MHEDTNACLFSLLNFIGVRDVPKSVIKNAVEFCNIENMRKMEIANKLTAFSMLVRYIENKTFALTEANLVLLLHLTRLRNAVMTTDYHQTI